MSNITDWIKYDLYPALFECIDRAFPELDFKRIRGDWYSRRKIDGSLPREIRADKTVVTKKVISRILEQGGENISLIDYVMRRDRVEFIQAVKTLASIAGLELPRGDYNDEEYQRHRDRLTILEDCNSYFIYCLENSTGAKDVKAYLSSRGYSDDDVKAMELGYIPSEDNLSKHLLSKGYTERQIKEVCSMGDHHKMSIPYRSGGAIKGFKFRLVPVRTDRGRIMDERGNPIEVIPMEQIYAKYRNSKGLDKVGGFFNLLPIKGDKDIVIVEGELDSLIATARGVENVVAAGGSSISAEQIKDAKRRGAKSFTLCFDREPDKEDDTAKNIQRAVDVILGEGVNRVYIVTLPDLGEGKTDPDRLIKERGVEAFKAALHGRLTYGAYIGDSLLSEYTAKQTDNGEIDYKDRDLLREKVVEIRSTLSPVDRVDFNRHLVEPLAAHGFTEEILRELEENHKTAIEEAHRSKKVKELLSKAEQDPSAAIDILKAGLKDIDATTGKGLLPEPMSFTTLLDEIATLPPAYKTGYGSLDKFIGFTPGGITLIAGRPSHGKTTFMFNLLLQMCEIYTEQKFYFFTYEEPVKNISVKLLNRLIDTDLSGNYSNVKDLSKPTNYEFIKHYIRAGRADILQIEDGKRKLRTLIDSQRITVIDSNYSVEQLSSLIAYLHKRESIGAVFIDYIQRMNTERRTQDKRTEIAHISDSVLQIAKQTSLPIILGAQLNRSTDMTKGKPKLENLKEAGNLEEDANTVISVYCAAREQEETESGERSSKQRTVDLEIKTLKNREGEVNTSQMLRWDRWTGAIKDY